MRKWVMIMVAASVFAGCSTGDDLEVVDDGGILPGNPSDGDDDGSGASTGGEVTHLDTYRRQAGISLALVNESYLNTSSIRHAGYQSIEGQLTHEETNTSNPFFWGFNVGVRVSQAATNTPNTFPSNVNIVYEDVATAGGRDSVDLWWNSVYHRLPMMRHEVFAAGYGDRLLAADLEPNAGTPSTGPLYGTMNFAGNTGTARTLSFWPGNGTTGVFTSFNTNIESPDPLDGDQGAGDTNVAPAESTVGPPIHIIYPTVAQFNSMTVSVRVQGSSDELPAYVLVNAGAASLIGTSTTAFFNDTELSAGEIFIMPADPLTASTTYVVSVTASDILGTLQPLSWNFTTGSL